MSQELKPRLTTESFNQLLVEYLAGKHPHQRLGQLVVNHFDLQCHGDLFFCPSDERAEQTVRELLRSYQA